MSREDEEGGEDTHSQVGDHTTLPSSPSYATAPTSPATVRHARGSSFQRWRRQMQKAWRWGPTNNDDSRNDYSNDDSNYYSSSNFIRSSKNLELLANQKRQWYQIQSKAKNNKHYKKPISLYEDFFIVGLHSHANVEVIEDAFVKQKTWESQVAKSELLDLRKIQNQVQKQPPLEPQILFKYPPGKQAAMRESDIPPFCFPGGVKARMLERTPSMSDLNELVFGQEHLARDDLSFIFRLKVSDNATLYGVCLHVQEIVQRPPSILGAISPLTNSSCKSGRFLVSAPRCYCILTRVPFFELHYEMLNSILAQERLERITQFVSEMTLDDSVPRVRAENDEPDENYDSPNSQLLNGWMGYAIPADGVFGRASPSIAEREVSSCLIRQLEPYSPESASVSEASDLSHLRDIDRESRKSWGHYDDYSSGTSGSRSDSFERSNGNIENGLTSPDINSPYSSIYRLKRIESLDSVYSSVKGAGSEEEGEDTSSKHDAAGDERVKEWAKLHNNESLQIVCGYHLLPIPNRGVNEVNAQLAAAEEALALSMWTVATICRVLSLETVMTLISGVLLEKQVVVICPNLVEAAGDFLNVLRRYMESLCSNLRAHSITNVQSNNDKVSLLLKDSFIDSFPSRDQPFIKASPSKRTKAAGFSQIWNEVICSFQKDDRISNCLKLIPGRLSCLPARTLSHLIWQHSFN